MASPRIRPAGSRVRQLDWIGPRGDLGLCGYWGGRRKPDLRWSWGTESVERHVNEGSKGYDKGTVVSSVSPNDEQRRAFVHAAWREKRPS